MTRAELYDLIWREPMVHVAARLGISDVALRRICDRHQIARPRAGYWTKLAHGKKVERTPLSTVRLAPHDEVKLKVDAWKGLARKGRPSDL